MSLKVGDRVTYVNEGRNHRPWNGQVGTLLSFGHNCTVLFDNEILGKHKWDYCYEGFLNKMGFKPKQKLMKHGLTNWR